MCAPVGVLHRLVDAGRSVMVVEHHPHLLAACDWLVELGPGGGPEGGRLIASGTPDALAAADTPTAPYLRASAGGGAHDLAPRCCWPILRPACAGWCCADLFGLPPMTPKCRSWTRLRQSDPLLLELLALQAPDGSWSAAPSRRAAGARQPRCSPRALR